MAKIDLESLVKSAPDFIKAHKTSCFLAGMTLYASSFYLDYRVWANLKEGHIGKALMYGVAGRIPSLSGIGLMGAPAWFYYSKRILGKRRAAKTARYLSDISSRFKP